MTDVGCGDTVGDGSMIARIKNGLYHRSGDWWWCGKGENGIYAGVKLDASAGMTSCETDGGNRRLGLRWTEGSTYYRCMFNTEQRLAAVQAIG